MSIKTICKALFCFNCTKKEDTPVSSFGRFTTQEKKFEVPMPPIEPTKTDVIVKAFMFKYSIIHGVEDKPNQTTWSSDLYYNYRQAENASFEIIKNFMIDVNKARNTDAFEAMVFHRDFAVNCNDVITINAFDVVEVTFKNGVLVKTNEVMISEGDNIVYNKPENFNVPNNIVYFNI